MALSRSQKIFQHLIAAFVCLLPIGYCLLLPAASEPELLSVYAPQARYTLPVSEIDGRKYVGLVEIIQPLSTPELRAEGKRWRLRIPDPKTSGKTTTEAEFEEGSAIAKVRATRISLSGPARSENHRLLVPVHGIGSLLIPLLATDLIFHENSRRLFIGGTAELISSELHKGDASTLELHFPDPVSPNINSDGNTIKFSFTHDPVISFTDNEALNDKVFNSSSFVENNGTATLTVNGSSPLLAKFADNGRTIVISAAPAPPAAPAVAASPPPIPATEPPTSQPVLPSPIPELIPGINVHPPENVSENAPRVPLFLVVIDPGHGGNDPGARITPTLFEKDITLSLARKLRQELQSRHLAVAMLRDGDIDLSLDQRAARANLARPAVFISLHAEPGGLLRIYLPVMPALATGAADRNSFLPWDTAQSAFANDSASLANSTAAQFAKRDIVTQVRPAFLEPLHSIAAPAIAIEAPVDKKGLKITEDQIAAVLAETIVLRKPNTGAAQ